MSLSEAYIILGTLFMYLKNHGYKEHEDFGINHEEPQSWYLTSKPMEFLNSGFKVTWYTVCESDHFYVETQPNGWCTLNLQAFDDYIVKSEGS